MEIEITATKSSGVERRLQVAVPPARVALARDKAASRVLTLDFSVAFGPNTPRPTPEALTQFYDTVAREVGERPDVDELHVPGAVGEAGYAPLGQGRWRRRDGHLARGERLGCVHRPAPDPQPVQRVDHEVRLADRVRLLRLARLRPPPRR